MLLPLLTANRPDYLSCRSGVKTDRQMQSSELPNHRCLYDKSTGMVTRYDKAP
jgi:hypothetical protein